MNSRPGTLKSASRSGQLSPWVFFGRWFDSIFLNGPRSYGSCKDSKMIQSLSRMILHGTLLTFLVFQSDAIPPPFPPQGKLVDVGGWRLHLNCVGVAKPSAPTVVLE